MGVRWAFAFSKKFYACPVLLLVISCSIQSSYLCDGA